MEGDGIGDLTGALQEFRAAGGGERRSGRHRPRGLFLHHPRHAAGTGKARIPTRRPELLPEFVINGRCKAPAAAQDQNCRTGCVCAVPEALDQNLPLGVGTVNCCRVDWAVATENKE